MTSLLKRKFKKFNRRKLPLKKVIIKKRFLRKKRRLQKMEYLNRMAKKKIANQLTKPTRFTWSHSYTGGFLNKLQLPSKIFKIKVPFSISLIKRKNTIRKQIRATKFTLLSNIIRNKFRKVKFALKNKKYLSRSISKQRVNPVLRRNAWVSNVRAIILKNIIKKKIRAEKRKKKKII